MSALILVRHAHRELSDPGADNGLSKKGREQSRRLLAYFKRRIGKNERVTLLSSPKRRCLETLAPLESYLGCKTLVSDLLVEQKNRESPAAFRARISRALDGIVASREKSRRLIVLCSHGDWLPIALKRLCGANAELKKGGLAEIEDGSLVRLLEPTDL